MRMRSDLDLGGSACSDARLVVGLCGRHSGCLRACLSSSASPYTFAGPLPLLPHPFLAMICRPSRLARPSLAAALFSPLSSPLPIFAARRSPLASLRSARADPSYSDEFKYRPAASPVITEYLKDGRIRLRGATPGGVGVREEDIPLSPAAKAAKAAQARKDAEERALEQFKESKRKAKERRMKRKSAKGGREP